MSRAGTVTVYRVNPGGPKKEKTMAKRAKRAGKRRGKRRAKKPAAERRQNPRRKRRQNPRRKRASSRRRSNPRRQQARRRRNPGMSGAVKGALIAAGAGIAAGAILFASQYAAGKITSNYGKAGLATAVAVVGGALVGAINPVAGILVASQSTTQAAQSVYAGVTAASTTTAATNTTTTTQGVFGPGAGPRGRLVQGVFRGSNGIG